MQIYFVLFKYVIIKIPARKIIPSVSNEEQVKRHSNKQRQSSSLSSNNKSALPVEQKKRLASGDPQADRKMPAKLPTCDVVAGSGSFLLLSQVLHLHIWLKLLYLCWCHMHI